MRNTVRWFSVASLVFAACGDDDSEPNVDDASSSGSSSTSTTSETSTSSTTSSGTTGPDGTSSGGEELDRVDQILQDLTIAMHECPDRVWPGDTIDNYRSRQILLGSLMTDEAWLWNDQGSNEGDPPRISMGMLSSLPVEWQATFNVGELGGVPTVGVSLEDSQEANDAIVESGGELYVDSASLLAFHEGFHFLSDQDDWSSGGGSRTLPYPEPWEPRYVRAELRRALRAVLEEDASLRVAAYWQERFSADFPGEFSQARSYDVTEGSAEYASIVSAALAHLGCGADDAAVVDEAVAHLDAFQGTGYSGGREFYDLGVLAGLLLRRAGAQGWEPEVENGQPPVEIILTSVTPEPQMDDPALMAEVQDAVDQRNIMLGMEIEPMLDALTDPTFYRVVIDFNWLQGSFGLGGFYYLPDEPGQPDVWLNLDATFVPPSGATVTLLGETSLISVSTPCALSGGSAIVLTVPVADVDVDMMGLATSTADTATFDGLEVETVTDTDGYDWLCPVDAGGAPALLGPRLLPPPMPQPRLPRRDPQLATR